MTDYEVNRTSGQCGVCGKAFAEGEEFFSYIVEKPDGFERRDVAQECWKGPPAEAVCFFKTKLTRKEKPRRTFVDDEVLINFFLRLADSEEPFKLRFRFVLSLILLRKRLLKYDRTIREDGREFWEMRLMRDKTLHKVFNPALSDAEIEELTAELGSILQGQVAEGAAEVPDAGPEGEAV